MIASRDVVFARACALRSNGFARLILGGWFFLFKRARRIRASTDERVCGFSRFQNRLKAGLEYEINKGCENAKGRAFDDFQSFLTASLRELEPSYASPMLARMVSDSTLYGSLDPSRRKVLLQNVAAALPAVLQTASSTTTTTTSAASAAPDATSAPRGWTPPPVKKERASSATSVLTTKMSARGRAVEPMVDKTAPVGKAAETRASSGFPTGSG